MDKPYWSNYNSKFQQWRPYQKGVIATILNSNKKFFALRAPTGSGKSLIAMEVARKADRAYYLVHTKDLQSQMVYDFAVKQLKGRNNFVCPVLYKEYFDYDYKRNALDIPREIWEKVNCENCIMSHIGGCEHKPTGNDIRKGKSIPQLESEGKDCPYYLHKLEAMRHPYVVWNYMMFLVNQAYVGDFPKVDLLICDEGHLIENVIMSFINKTFTARMFNEAKMTFPRRDEIMKHLQLTKERLKEKLKEIDQGIKEVLPREDQKGKGHLDDLIKDKRRLGWYIRNIESFFEIYDARRWVMEYDKGRKIIFKPIKVDNFTKNLLFRWGKKVLMMSATLPPEDIISSSLGIEGDNLDFMSIPSTFESRRRSIVYTPIGKMTYDFWVKNLPFAIDWIKSFISSHPDDNILIHTVNSIIMKKIEQSLAGLAKKLYVAHGHKRQEEIEAFKKGQSSILISPSCETGVDLPYGMCRYQIIVKLPFPSIADKQVSARMEEDERWYNFQAVSRLVQMTGRHVRASDDWGESYILDSLFPYFFKKNRDMFPLWWIDAIVWERRQGKNE